MTKIVGAKPKWLLLSVAVLVGVATSATLPSAATAATFPHAAQAAGPVLRSGGGDGCNPGRADNSLTYYWIGAVSQTGAEGVAKGGVYANIRTYSPFVAGPNQGAPSNDSVSEWVMLDPGDLGTPNSDQWAQIGWLEFPGGARDTFIQYADGSNDLHTFFYAPSAINSTQTYGVLYQPGGPFTLSENGTGLASAELSWSPTSADIYAELHTEASQVPGGTADPPGQVATVSNAHVWPVAGSGSWAPFDGYTLYSSVPTSAPTYFIGIAPNGTGGNTSWRTWDKACTT